MNRSPAVAGQFYPGESGRLIQEMEKLFSVSVPKKCNGVRAIISPHAGYVFSGGVAASAFNQIDRNTIYKRIFIIASSHQTSFDGASVYCDGDFLMPYGREAVDTSFGKMLTDEYPELFTSDRTPHLNEHSIEVQLPFLHHVLKTGYNIVPIVIGTSKSATCKAIAAALKPYFTSESLFIISTDFSHYPNYQDATNIDTLTKDAILTNDPDTLLSTLREISGKRIPHLATAMCGWTSVLTLLYMTEKEEFLKYCEIDYKNSGDTKYYGEKDRVVGYWAIAIYEKQGDEKDSHSHPYAEDCSDSSGLAFDTNNGFNLTDQDKKILLSVARESVESAALTGRKSRSTVNPDDFSDILKTKCGAFVTLHKKGKLRGCVGRLTGDISLFQMVREMAVSAALYDYRFQPLEREELEEIEIEISVLSPLVKIENKEEIILGKHGIYIEKGRNSGVFLPQVATETGWSLEEFLGHCSRDKAGLGWDGWKTAELFIFTATVFS